MTLTLETRKKLAVAAANLRTPSQPAVFVAAPKPSRKAQETREQAELRRERVEAITRRAPEVVITSRWVHTASSFDAQSAVVVRLPIMARLINWLKSDLA